MLQALSVERESSLCSTPTFLISKGILHWQKQRNSIYQGTLPRSCHDTQSTLYASEDLIKFDASKSREKYPARSYLGCSTAGIISFLLSNFESLEAF